MGRLDGKVAVVTGGARGAGDEQARVVGRDLAAEATARAALDRKHPLGTGEPDDIAWGAVHLASDEARWVTGGELVIDGGYTAR